jgi:hypothetical protein
LKLATLGEDLEDLVAGDALAAVELGYAFREPSVECGLADLKPFFFGLEEVEGLGDEFVGGG